MAILEPGKFYHVYTQGNNKETVFKEKENYYYFLQLYRKYISPYADTFAYCLLPNHFHLLIRVREEELIMNPDTLGEPRIINLVRQFQHLLNAYAKAINIRYNRTGSLFQERFKRKEITSEAYFTRLVFYIHHNPQHHGLIEDFSDWPYSSYHSILSKGTTVLQRENVLDWFGGRASYKNFHEENAADFTSTMPLLEEDEL
ncbi:hypothetical protein [Pontibacter pamirensis]|uniref:hypothetical protein n=1 Tax=Pontibacter pamirensis TaxID=2562824 RepID=UPI00192E3D62|nr:hypothetical protein [Pontibacter pamirensis]